jgi:ComF family protein
MSALAMFERHARRVGNVMIDAVLPPRCLSCGAMVTAPAALCAACWPKIAFLDPPWCASCGLPFEYDAGVGSLCGACSREPPAFARARAAFRYDEESRHLLTGFKHADRTFAVPAFASWMLRAAGELLRDRPLLVPVPLHWTRLWRRRYNQAALLAQAIARASELEVAVDLLHRRRRTPSQGGLGRHARERNVRGAFLLAPQAASVLAGRRALLIDDVLTTGATAGACARRLLEGGASAVDVLTLARVVRPQD